MSITTSSNTSDSRGPRPGDWLVGGGEMGALIRNKEWSQTPLGPLEGWPQSLRSAVSILLPSKAQIVLFWGPELVALYNDAYRPVFGAKHPWALSTPARESWSELWDVLEPLFQGVITTGEAFWAKDHLFVMDRHGYTEETYFDVSYDPVRDESGRVGGLFCIVSETTGWIIGQRRLAALRDLGRIDVDATSVADVYRNAAAVLQRYDKDIPFAAFYQWNETTQTATLEASTGLHAATADAVARIDASNRNNLWPVGEEEEIALADMPSAVSLPVGPWPESPRQVAVCKIASLGKPHGYLVAGLSSRRLIDEDYRDFLRLVGAHIASAVARVQALEEERRRAASLAELDRAKTAFFSNVSHEFRTPLTLMLGPLETLSATAENAEQRQLLGLMHRNGQRLLKLVNTLLDFARIEAGRAQVRFEATDISALTADLASNFRSACEAAGIELIVECPALPDPAYIDGEMWEKIVLNLLSNAFKFTLAGRITVRLSDAGDFFELSVRDTGCGIPNESLGKVFDRFHRVEGTRGRSYEGSGIGLALVSELVKLHGGSISVESEPGEGSCFTVRIPQGSSHLPGGTVHARESSSAGKEAAASYVAEVLSWLPSEETAPAEAPEHAQRILLADDNADLRDYARRLLADDYFVECVADGEAALAAARRHRPHLIVSDVMMPHMDGFELLREIRADAELRSIPVVLLSARAGEEARIEGLDRGADDYIVKPFSSKEFLVRVAAILKSAELHSAAREASARFATLLDNAPLGVYLVDDEFRIAAMNPIAVPAFGNIPNVIGRDFDEIIHTLWPTAYADEIVGQFRRTLETGHPYFVQERIERRLDRGVVEYYEWQINRIPLAQGRVGVVCYFRDISKFVSARDALRDADLRKDEFLATLAHELRNPLAPLRSSLEALRLGGMTGKHAPTAVSIMERQVTHLVRLVDDLLEVSRITRGTMELRKEPLRLDAAISNALEACESLIRAGGHRMTVSLPSEPIVVDADPVRLAQIFGNLLNNAAKYSESGGTITVEAWRENDEAVVVVSDTGDGIEPEQLQQLFKLFARGHGTAKRHQSGLGIGLALVRRLVEMHGGRVDAASDGAGKGSRFTVRLPISPSHQPNLVTERPVPNDSRSHTKIMLVDDNRDAAESLHMVLLQLGADVLVVHSGAAALEAFASYRPQLVLLDIGMPIMDGYAVARALRVLNYIPRPTLVALTGWAQESDRLRAHEAGFDHHLVKPIEVGLLQALISSLLTLNTGEHTENDALEAKFVSERTRSYLTDRQ